MKSKRIKNDKYIFYSFDIVKFDKLSEDKKYIPIFFQLKEE
jgi:hypothetical protein